MPPPSKRLDLKVMVPEVMWSSRVRSAHPVALPRSRAVVAADSLLVIAADVVQAPNDKQQHEPMHGKISDLPAEFGKVEALLADTGYFSEGNVNACAAAGVEPVIAMGREAHLPSLDERFAAPPPAPCDPSPLEAMGYRLKTSAG